MALASTIRHALWYTNSLSQPKYSVPIKIYTDDAYGINIVETLAYNSWIQLIDIAYLDTYLLLILLLFFL